MSSGIGMAAQHSQTLEAWFVHTPGLVVVMPSTPYDAKGLLKSAIRDDNPVVFLERRLHYGRLGPVPDEEYTLPIGVADVKRVGTDVTVVAYSGGVQLALQAGRGARPRGHRDRGDRSADAEAARPRRDRRLAREDAHGSSSSARARAPAASPARSSRASPTLPGICSTRARCA